MFHDCFMYDTFSDGIVGAGRVVCVFSILSPLLSCHSTPGGLLRCLVGLGGFGGLGLSGLGIVVVLLSVSGVVLIAVSLVVLGCLFLLGGFGGLGLSGPGFTVFPLDVSGVVLVSVLGVVLGGFGGLGLSPPRFVVFLLGVSRVVLVTVTGVVLGGLDGKACGWPFRGGGVAGVSVNRQFMNIKLQLKCSFIGEQPFRCFCKDIEMQT